MALKNPPRTVRGSDRKPPAVELPATAVPELGGLIHDLIKGGEDVVRELYFSHHRLPHGGVANAKPHDAGLIEGGVKHPVPPKLFL
jgi:hypothetical protein